MKNKYKFLGLLGLLPFFAGAQLTNNGATIVIEQGATLVVEGAIMNTAGEIQNSGIIVAEDDFMNTGTLMSTGEIQFTGDEEQTFTPGANASVGTVVINQDAATTGDVVLANDLTITSALTLTNGKLDIGANDLTLPDDGAIASSEAAYVKADAGGKVVRAFNNSSSFTFPIGGDEYSPLTAEVDGGTDTDATISVNVEEDATTTSTERPFGAEDYVDRDWDITTANFDAAEEIVMRGQYQDSDLTGDENNMVGALYDINAANEVDEWTYPSSGVDVGNNRVFTTVTGNDELLLSGINTLRRQSIRVFLAGAYNGTNMNTGLNAATADGLIPNSSPYTSAPASIAGLVKNFAGGTVVDWVEVELRTDPAVAGTSYSKFLLSDGSIVDPAAGSSIATFRDAPASAHIAVKHRNHLGVMSDDAITMGTNEVDFTASTTATEGANAQYIPSTGVTAMWGGDVNGDGFVTFQSVDNDRDAILSALSLEQFNFLETYNDADVNLDGFTLYQSVDNDRDKILLILNGNQFGFAQQNF